VYILVLFFELSCEPVLVRQVLHAYVDEKHDKKDDSTDMRPHIDSLIVALKEAFAYIAGRSMINAVTSSDVDVIDLMFFSLISWADIGAMRSIRKLLA